MLAENFASVRNLVQGELYIMKLDIFDAGFGQKGKTVQDRNFGAGRPTERVPTWSQVPNSGPQTAGAGFSWQRVLHCDEDRRGR